MVSNNNNSNPLRNLTENGVPHFLMAEETPFHSPETQESLVDDPIVNVFQDVRSGQEHLGLSPSSIQEGGMAVPQGTEPLPLMTVVTVDLEDSVFLAIQDNFADEATDLVQNGNEDDQDCDGSQSEGPGKRNMTQDGISTQEQENLSSSHLDEYSDPAQENLEDVDRDEVEGRGNRPVKRKLAIENMSPQDQENLSSQPKYLKTEELLLGSSGPSQAYVDQETHWQDAWMEDDLLVIVVQEQETEDEENVEEEIDDDSPSGWTYNGR